MSPYIGNYWPGFASGLPTPTSPHPYTSPSSRTLRKSEVVTYSRPTMNFTVDNNKLSYLFLLVSKLSIALLKRKFKVLIPVSKKGVGFSHFLKEVLELRKSYY